MTEIWLNYGQNEVVLDIQAENLDQRLSVEGQTLEGSKVDEKLDGIDLSKPTEIALLNYTNSVQEVLGKIFEKCEVKSFSKPKIFSHFFNHGNNFENHRFRISGFVINII